MADRPDFDDPAVEEAWAAEMRERVVTYLVSAGVSHGQVGEWPAWHVAPYVAVWAVESRVTPGALGWWVICGDLPTDYVSAAEIKHPREVLNAISARWRELSDQIRQGRSTGELSLDGSDTDPQGSARMLSSRASTLAEWAGDDEIWIDV